MVSRLLLVGPYGGFPKLGGLPFLGPHNKDYNIFGSILGSPYFGKLPYKLKSNHMSCSLPLDNSIGFRV